jgi:hypothetical protein
MTLFHWILADLTPIFSATTEVKVGGKGASPVAGTLLVVVAVCPGDM